MDSYTLNVDVQRVLFNMWIVRLWVQLYYVDSIFVRLTFVCSISVYGIFIMFQKPSKVHNKFIIHCLKEELRYMIR